MHELHPFFVNYVAHLERKGRDPKTVQRNAFGLRRLSTWLAKVGVEPAAALEAKRGWSLPTEDQLRQYRPRLEQFEIGRILVVSECTPEFAQPQLPGAIEGVPVVYRSWKQIVQLAEACAPTAHAEKRILRELSTYLRGLMTMQKQTSNMVYVVSLGTERTDWSGTLTPVEIVTHKNVYFCQIGGGYPKEPPNYLGFRWYGRLQQIRTRPEENEMTP
jgi:hypothetical protein